jgi:replicative DNA helicase
MGCTPPFPDSEVRKVVRSIARRDAATRAHEVGKGLPRHQVIEGNQWAEELRVSPARQGVLVPVPGLIGLNGLVPGDLVVIAGRPGMGKSTWGCQLAVEACLRRQMPTWIVSTEMTRAQWGEWMAAIVAGKTTAGLPRPLTDDILSWFRQAPIAITDSGTMTIQELRSLAHGRLGVQLIIVDHLTRLSGTRKENRVLEVGEIARGLKALAKDLRCTVVALCQLNRRVEGDDSRKPRLADLRESGEIEQEADAVILLWTPERDIHQVLLPMHLSFAKNRHGPLAHYSVTFDKLGRKFVPSGERT